MGIFTDGVQEDFQAWLSTDAANLLAAYASMFEPAAGLVNEEGSQDEPETWTPAWSTLLNIETCPAWALPYLSMFNGSGVQPGQEEGAARQQILTNAVAQRGRPAAITAAALQNLTEITLGLYDPIAWWRLSDPPGSVIAADFSDNGNTASMGGQGVSFGASGPITTDPTAASFSGTGWLTTPLSGAFTASAYTVSMWVNPASVTAPVGNPYIISKLTGPSASGGVQSINTTGANAIIIALANNYAGFPATTPTDSVGNVYFPTVEYDAAGDSGVTFFYCLQPHTSPTHTFTTTSAQLHTVWAVSANGGAFTQGPTVNGTSTGSATSTTTSASTAQRAIGFSVCSPAHVDTGMTVSAPWTTAYGVSGWAAMFSDTTVGPTGGTFAPVWSFGTTDSSSVAVLVLPLDNSANTQGIFGTRPSTTATQGLTIEYIGGSAVIQKPGSGASASCSFPIPQNKWSHLAVTGGNSNAAGTVYLNGVAQGSVGGTNTQLPATTGGVQIGRAIASGSDNYIADGTFDADIINTLPASWSKVNGNTNAYVSTNWSVSGAASLDVDHVVQGSTSTIGVTTNSIAVPALNTEYFLTFTISPGANVYFSMNAGPQVMYTNYGLFPGQNQIGFNPTGSNTITMSWTSTTQFSLDSLSIIPEYSSPVDVPFVGEIADVAVFNQVLSSNQINNYLSGSGPIQLQLIERTNQQGLPDPYHALLLFQATQCLNLPALTAAVNAVKPAGVQISFAPVTGTVWAAEAGNWQSQTTTWSNA